MLAAGALVIRQSRATGTEAVALDHRVTQRQPALCAGALRPGDDVEWVELLVKSLAGPAAALAPHPREAAATFCGEPHICVARNGPVMTRGDELWHWC
jgi:hypothetical protein